MIFAGKTKSTSEICLLGLTETSLAHEINYLSTLAKLQTNLKVHYELSFAFSNNRLSTGYCAEFQNYFQSSETNNERWLRKTKQLALLLSMFLNFHSFVECKGFLKQLMISSIYFASNH